MYDVSRTPDLHTYLHHQTGDHPKDPRAVGDKNDKKHTQTQELMEKAVESVNASIAKGKEVEPDEELGRELYELVKEAAAELGIDAPPMV